MTDERPDIYVRLAAAGLDLTAIRAATTAALTREDQAAVLVHAFGALRQRDLAPLMGVSAATISRLVTALLAAGKVRQQVFRDGGVGRPTEWLLPPEGDSPSYQRRQTIIASLPDIIAALDTMPRSAAQSSAPGPGAVEQPPISALDRPGEAVANVPPVSHEETTTQLAFALWFGTIGEDPRAKAEISMPEAVAEEILPIVSPPERLVPLPPTATYVSLPWRSHTQSPIPPWERTRILSRQHWRGRPLVRRSAVGLALGMGQAFRLTLLILVVGGHLLWAGLRLLGRGIQKLVWLFDDLNDIVVGRRWLLLGVAVAIVVGVLVGLRGQRYGARLPVAAAPPEVTPTGIPPTDIAPQAPATAMPTPLGQARVVGTGKAGLIVRDAPAGKRIGKLVNGAVVIVLGGPQTIANQEDPIWWNIRHGDIVGWVSARFLHVLNTP
jgi:hypothetical protein